MFFNNDGLTCNDGQLLNLNILVHGFCEEKVSRELLAEEYLKNLRSIAVTRDPDWFFSNKGEFQSLLISEFEKISGRIKLDKLELTEFEYADECLNDKEKAQEFRKAEKEQIQQEVAARIASLDEERLREEKKLESEKDAAIAKIEKNVALEIARAEAELAAEVAKNEEALAMAEAELESSLKKAEAQKDKDLKEEMERED